MKDDFSYLENIGESACVLLRGHVVQLVERSLQNTPVKVISKCVAIYILRTWKEHKDYWKLLRFDYQDTVRTLAEQVVEIFQVSS